MEDRIQDVLQFRTLLLKFPQIILLLIDLSSKMVLFVNEQFDFLLEVGDLLLAVFLLLVLFLIAFCAHFQ